MIQIDSGDEPDAVDQGPDGVDPGPLGVGQAADRPGSPLAITQIDEGREGAGRLEGDQRVSLRFAEPLPIAELLLLLLRGTPFSVVADSDVEGSFMGELKEVTLLEALDLVLRPPRTGLFDTR